MNWKARPWHAALSTVTMAVVLGWSAPEVHALAVGRITVLSALGQPLRAEIDILNIDSEESATLKAGIASADAFRGAGMDYNPLLQNVTVSIVRRSDGRTVLQLASERPVNEPFVDLILETSWATGRILRGYTMLFDPPRIQVQEAAASPARTVPAVTVPAPAPASAATVAPAGPQIARKSDKGSGDQVVVKPGDTAGRIANQHKPANVSLDQMLVALLQANPDAFVRGNLNRLKAGSVLNIPGAEQAGATPAGEASRMVVAQSQDFGEFRKKLAENVPTAPTTAAQRQASGTVKAQVDEKKGGAAAPDKLTLSKGSTQAKAAADAASKDKQAKEASARVAELAKNISELNKVKGALTAASAAAGTATGAAAAVSTATAQANVPTPSVVAAAPAVAATPTPQASPAATKPAAATNPKPTPAPEATLLDQILGNRLVLLAGGGLIVLLAAIGILRARRGRSVKAGPQASVLDSRLQPESFFKASGHNVEPNAAAAGSSMMYSPSQLDSAGDVDPVAEADVYLAYGRDIQAEEILREAMRLNPTRLAIHAKLLGIFAKRRDLKSFEAMAREAHELSSGAGPEWDVIAKMGQELDPTNPLFGGDSPASVKTFVLPAAQSAPPVDRGASTSAGADAHAEPAPAETPSPPGKADVDLDFDLDISPASASGSVAAPTAPSPAVAPAAAPVATPPIADEGLISFDLDNVPVPAPAPVAAPVAPAPSADAGMIEFDMGGLSLDLDAPAAEPGSAIGGADDPLATKLALAEEFEAIGDTEGAKLILEEVIAEASGDLKVRAQKALSKLG